jgi:hypothetical protein
LDLRLRELCREGLWPGDIIRALATEFGMVAMAARAEVRLEHLRTREGSRAAFVPSNC